MKAIPWAQGTLSEPESTDNLGMFDLEKAFKANLKNKCWKITMKEV